ncbi:MAG: VWA domain-containing protein [Acidobacteriaceae bacterium]|jgi:Ca-activated chloride channel family protein|nr:VWA domain-containing protein [Acidobacteriaceae bacterium]
MRAFPRRVVSIAVLLTLAAVETLYAQTPASAVNAESLRLVSPEANSYATGTMRLKAEADDAAAVENVTFFVDSQQICVAAAAPFECEWDAGSEVAPHQVRAIFGLTGGGRLAKTVRTKGLGFADKVNVDVVQVTVTVTDDSGHFVADIPRDAFTIYENGAPQAVTYFQSDDVPLELLVAVDISGSMTAFMPQLKTAVKQFLSAVPAEHQVTLLGFNDTVFPLARKTTDLAERVRAVDRLMPWGATALYDSIVRGVDMLGRQPGRKALVVFSDGEDQGSHVALEDVERRLQASDVTLYIIAEGRGISQQYLKKTMQRLTTPTGGRTFTTESAAQLEATFAELLDELSHQYLLGYPPTNAARDDSWREIRVDVAGHSGVRARQGYRAAPE